MSGVSPKVRQVVAERDLWTCVRCGRYVGPFGTYSLHHRRPRGAGGSRRADTNLPANLVTLCGHATSSDGCHYWAEKNRDDARSVGLLVRQGARPASVPVLTWRGLLLLDDSGDWMEVES